MKTAVQWLVEQVNSDCLNSVFIKIELIEQAKEMEKNNYICSKCKCSLDGKDMQQMQDKENT